MLKNVTSKKSLERREHNGESWKGQRGDEWDINESERENENDSWLKRNHKTEKEHKNGKINKIHPFHLGN